MTETINYCTIPYSCLSGDEQWNRNQQTTVKVSEEIVPKAIFVSRGAARYIKPSHLQMPS